MSRPHTMAMVILLVLGAGCEDGFDPKGSFDQGLAVYSILRSTSDSQFVRVHMTYDPPGFDPLEHTTEPDLSGASVVFRSDSGVITLRDSLVSHPDPLRYGGQLRVFYESSFRPHRGLPYTLTVGVPGYEQATSMAIVPSPPLEFRVSNTGILSSPRLYETQDISVVFKAPPEARGFLARFYIEYEVLAPSVSVERTEIPLRMLVSSGNVTLQYPELAPLVPAIDRPFSVVTYWSFQTEAYRFMLDDIVQQYGLSNLRFRAAIFHLYLVDESLYKYYHIANGFRDEYSIRTDLPDYSNVQGGVGVVGAISLDSLRLTVTPNIQF